ncbi:DoxX family membrane protein [Nocardioides sp. AE5]|uniref:DoxX family protein n=1 Tax=Nocardioides sp. AE5 TaxID=2962573 RepID=UPI0028816530|nr:DoxX family membrane protein [Nocardioides sp. AE5]MDT0201526.1 DoxX family membrane protein [Nocardioides sp. AE5]
MTLVRLIARPLIASGFILGATHALKHSDVLAEKATRVTDRVVPLVQRAAPGAPVPSDARTLVRINAGVQIAAAAALATGRAPRISATVLAASLVPTTVAGHAFWAESDPGEKRRQRLQFAKNLSVLGGLLLASVDTDGRPGLAWRAGHAARTARKDARRLARDVRREAKLAKAQLT